MIDVYYYMPAGQTEDAVECGIKLSEWYSKEIHMEGEVKKCISALLNPRDDHEKYLSPEYRCLTLEVQPKHCFVADGMLYRAGQAYPEAMELYHRSIMPVEKYAFGSYRSPECLITATIIGEHVHVPGKGLDMPILYNNSQELYFNNLLEYFREVHDDFNDTMLYYLFKRLCDEGKAACIEDIVSGLAVFTYHNDGRVYTLRIPDLEKY